MANNNNYPIPEAQSFIESKNEHKVPLAGLCRQAGLTAAQEKIELWINSTAHARNTTPADVEEIFIRNLGGTPKPDDMSQESYIQFLFASTATDISKSNYIQLEVGDNFADPAPFASAASTDILSITCKKNILQKVLSTMLIDKSDKSAKIVINLEDGKAWWAQSGARDSLKTFGSIEDGVGIDCWGNGSVGLNVSYILKNIKHMREIKEVTLLADPKDQIIYLKAEDEGVVDEYSHWMIPQENIPTAILEKPVIPRMNELYGADVNVLRLIQVVERAKAFHAGHIPLSMAPNVPAVTAHLEYGTDQCVMAFPPGSSKSYLRVPPVHSFEHIVSLADLEPVVENYTRRKKYCAEAPPRDIVSLRFGDNQLYLLKKEMRGKFVSGAIIPTKVNALT